MAHVIVPSLPAAVARPAARPARTASASTTSVAACAGVPHGARASLSARLNGTPTPRALAQPARPDGRRCQFRVRAEASTAPPAAATTAPRVCILGGGFGGLYTALRLASLPWPQGVKPEITLVDRSEKFVFKPLLYELLNGGVEPGEVAPPFADLLAGTEVVFKQAVVRTVDHHETGHETPGGTVMLEGGEQLEYDWLVLALGAQTRFGDVQGVKEHAMPFATMEDAVRTDEALTALESGKQGSSIGVVVVGGGPSGVELAATVAERLGAKGEVEVLTSGGEILEANPAGQREAAGKALTKNNCLVLTNCRVSAIRKDEEASRPYTVVMEDGRESTADLVLWTAGQTPVVPQATREAVDAYGIQLAARGEAMTDSFLRVRSQSHLFALGDAAFVQDAEGNKLPATAQVAFQAADYAGWNLWASINRRPLLPFKYQHLGDMMALGTVDAAVAFPLDLTVDGMAASVLRKAAYVYRQPTLDQAAKVGLGMVSRPLEGLLGINIAKLLGQ